MKYLESVNFEIVNYCNLKCKMCDIWKYKDATFLSKELIQGIFLDKLINNETDITITGGEPLLYPDIFGLFDIIYLSGNRVATFSTNGILEDKLLNLINYCLDKKYEIPNIHISIDGLEKTHDLQRGVEGSFLKTLKTIISLKKLFKNIKIKIKYTITQDNIGDIKKVYELSKKLGVDISYKIIDNDTYYTNIVGKPFLLNNLQKETITDILSDIYGKDNEYINSLIHYLKTKKLSFPCETYKNNIFILANGDVHTCTKYKSIGNINNALLKDIMIGKNNLKMINYLNKIKCNKCFSFHGSYKSFLKNNYE